MAGWYEDGFRIPDAKQVWARVLPGSEYTGGIPTAYHDALERSGLCVNLHILEFYSWDTSTKSTYPNVLAELIRNCLTNFNTSSQLSLATILFFESCSRTRRSTLRCGKVRLLLKLLHKLGASCQMTSAQKETEQRILRLTKEHVMAETRLHPIVECLRNLDPHHRYDGLTQAHDELGLFQKQRRTRLQYSPTLQGSPFGNQWDVNTSSRKSHNSRFHRGWSRFWTVTSPHNSVEGYFTPTLCKIR